MLTFLFVLAAPPVEPPPIQFDQLTLTDAQQLAGDARITFTPGTPAYTWEVNGVLRTICGPADPDDDQERTVMLRGDRVRELRDDEPVTVRGRLRVIHHEAANVNGRLVPAWDEIRFEER